MERNIIKKNVVKNIYNETTRQYSVIIKELKLIEFRQEYRIIFNNPQPKRENEQYTYLLKEKDRIISRIGNIKHILRAFNRIIENQKGTNIESLERAIEEIAKELNIWNRLNNN